MRDFYGGGEGDMIQHTCSTSFCYLNLVPMMTLSLPVAGTLSIKLCALSSKEYYYNNNMNSLQKRTPRDKETCLRSTWSGSSAKKEERRESTLNTNLYQLKMHWYNIMIMLIIVKFLYENFVGLSHTMFILMVCINIIIWFETNYNYCAEL